MLSTLARGMFLLFLAFMLVSWALTQGRGGETQPPGNSAVVYYMFS
jgi:hypothetical protein